MSYCFLSLVAVFHTFSLSCVRIKLTCSQSTENKSAVVSWSSVWSVTPSLMKLCRQSSTVSIARLPRVWPTSLFPWRIQVMKDSAPELNVSSSETEEDKEDAKLDGEKDPDFNQVCVEAAFHCYTLRCSESSRSELLDISLWPVCGVGPQDPFPFFSSLAIML